MNKLLAAVYIGGMALLYFVGEATGQYKLQYLSMAILGMSALWVLLTAWERRRKGGDKDDERSGDTSRRGSVRDG